MTLLLAPFIGMLATPAAWALIAALAHRRHTRADADDHELAEIDAWLERIKAVR